MNGEHVEHVERDLPGREPLPDGIGEILHRAPAVMYVYDAQDRFEYVNRRFEESLGMTADEVIGVDLDQLMPAEVAGQFLQANEQVRRTGRSHTLEEQAPHPDGLHTYLTVKFPLPGGKGRVAGISTDITAQRDAQRLLTETEQQFRDLLDEAPDIVMALDVEGRITFANARLAELHGGTPAELEGQVAHELYPAPLGEQFDRMHRAVVDRSVPMREEFQTEIDGHPVSFAVVQFPLRRSAAGPRGVGVIATDVSAERARSRELQRLRVAADDANVAKSAFLSRISHELRTPLNAVLGFAQLLELGELDDEQRDAAEQIRRSGRHLLGLIDDVLQISRVEARELTYSIEQVFAASCVRDACDIVGPLSQEHGVRIEVDVPEELDVDADHQRLVQVLVNLLSNAIKYGGAGPVRVSAATHGDLLRIAVRDEGPGMTAEHHRRLFTPFDRLGAEQTSVEGTGLGLAFSQALVAGMGGTLELASAPGAGTTAAIDLPVASTYPVEPTPQALSVLGTEPTPNVSGLVMSIEDNPASARLIEQLLSQRRSVDLLATTRGDRGLELARAHHPDLILLDLHLPGKDGAAVLRELRSDPTTATTPVVVLTADTTVHDSDRLAGLDVTAVLSKPIVLADVLALIDATLSKAGPS